MNKKLIINIIGITLCVLLFVVAVFLGITSMAFYSGENQSAPNIFGYNIYIVKDNDFYQLKSGTAALAQTVWPDEVYSGEIIIYRMGEGNAVKLGVVRKATLKEAVMSYEIENELGDSLTLSQGQLVAKVTHFSDFLGGFIRFATSPFGVMAIALLPCLALIIFELVRFIICRLPAPEVETVKKQEELPTFVSRKEQEELTRKREQEKEEKKALAKEKRVLSTDKSTAVSKSDEFTERMRQKKAQENAQKQSADVPAVKNPSEVRDRADFSAAARRRMEEDSKKAEEKAKAEEEKKPPVIERPAPVIPDITKDTEGEPAISQVFSEEKDKGYNIDDILADITGRK